MLIGGGGQTRDAWSGAVAALADQRWHAVAVDLRGSRRQRPVAERRVHPGRLQEASRRVTAAELQELIPHAGVVDVAGAGHMVAGDRNDRFNAAILDVLDRVVRPTLTGATRGNER